MYWNPQRICIQNNQHVTELMPDIRIQMRNLHYFARIQNFYQILKKARQLT